MPLFGHKDKNLANEPIGRSNMNPAHTATGVGATDYGNEPGAMNAGFNAPYEGTGMHHHQGLHHGAGNMGGVGAGNMAGVGAAYNEPRYNPATAGDYNEPGAFGAGQGHLAGQGMAGHGGNMSGAPDIPPTGALNTSNQSSHGGGGSLSGKVERAIGTLVGSQSLKAKGAEKEAEAKAYKMQSAELSEAERLEGQARMRRERAVAHGAHPDNINLGAGVGTNHMRNV